MMFDHRLLLAFALLLTPFAHAQKQGVLGDWWEPKGSIVEIFPCGADVCAKIVAISKSAPTQLDIHNPDTAARTHALCGLQIGYGFHLTDPAHADGGKLYDPKSGKTYRGSLTAEGDELHLRGYVGIKAFGKSETWIRGAAHCRTLPQGAGRKIFTCNLIQ